MKFDAFYLKQVLQLASGQSKRSKTSLCDGTHYLIRDNRYKSAFTSGAVFEGLGYRWEDVSVISDAELAQYSNHPTEPLLYSPFPNGSLIKKTGEQAVYVITNSKKRLIASGTAFEKAGYNWGLIISELSSQTVDNIPGIQPPIDESNINQCNGGISTSGGGDPNPTFTSTASASPNPALTNQPVTVTVNLTNTSLGASDTVMNLEVYNSSGQRVFQDFREHQYFAASQTQTYSSLPWTPSAAGQYTVKIGVFSSGWLVVYHWSDNALILSVGSGASHQIDIWWPTDGAQVSGTQPFKALVPNLALGDYSMHWQVDGGNLVLMYDSYQDYPHKEAMVDLTGWSWRGNGPYVVNFVAKNSVGSVIAQRSVSIYVLH